MSLLHFPLPKALRQPAGIVFLHPSERVSRVELERRDKQYQAIRAAEYARAWSEDATLVGGIVYNTSANGTNDRSSLAGHSSIRRRRRNVNVACRISKRLRLKMLRGLFSTHT